MIFHDLPLPGARLIEIEPRSDDRGFFARAFCEEEFAKAGLVPHYPQINMSGNRKRGTFRGFHYQLPPRAEVKVLRCIRGSVYDVMIDLRPQSPTYLKSCGAEISADNRKMLYTPMGFAHGYIALTDDAEVLYMASDTYSAADERGLRWNDPRFSIELPIAPEIISPKDAGWPDFDPEYHGVERFRELGPV